MRDIPRVAGRSYEAVRNPMGTCWWRLLKMLKRIETPGFEGKNIGGGPGLICLWISVCITWYHVIQPQDG